MKYKTEPNEPINISYNSANVYQNTGLTKREYFAAMALQGLLATGDYQTQIAKDAIYWADALIEELNKTR